MKKVLVLGGYGNFGRRIVVTLAKAGIAVIIAGRNAKAAESLAQEVAQQYPDTPPEIAIFNIDKTLPAELVRLKPNVVINTCGPFQAKNYAVANNCIEHHTHYIDLSDGRSFVNEITTLDQQAKKADIAVISGASTVPGLSSAVLEQYKNSFQSIHTLRYGISPGQQASRGLATTEAILSYLGKPLKSAPGNDKIHYGWQDTYRQAYPIIGKRWMANCDIPDIDLFPSHYKIQHIHFSAGMESSVLHLGMWLLSWLVRLGLPLHLSRHAAFLLKTSHWFDCLGTPDGGMHMILEGADHNGQPKIQSWFIVATDGDGPQIPIIPAIVLTKELINGTFDKTGAMPCVGLVSLDDYLTELQDFHITVTQNP